LEFNGKIAHIVQIALKTPTKKHFANRTSSGKF
jgi:hypothetical protein